MTKKLYVVKVTYQGYVLAEDLKAAKDFAYDIVRNEDPEVDATFAHGNVLGWPSEEVVYHDGEGNFTLGAVLGEGE